MTSWYTVSFDKSFFIYSLQNSLAYPLNQPNAMPPVYTPNIPLQPYPMTY